MRLALVAVVAAAAAGCAKGSLGPAGPQGPQGDRGATGAQGPQGLQGPQGAVGPQGSSVLTVVLPAGDAHCADGGVKVVAVTGDTYVCNGPAGAQGATGAQGLPGVSVTTTAVAAGDSHCATGGIKVTSASGDTYVCTGAQGPTGDKGATGAAGATGGTGPAGVSVTSVALAYGDPSCPFGGTRFTSGNATSYACSGLAMPVGSILGWHKSLAGTPALPDGWAECNGQTISDPASPYNGGALPNLNGRALFLRGGAISGNVQGDQLQAHAHANDLHTNGGGAATTGTDYPDHQHEIYTSANFAGCPGSGIHRTTYTGDGSGACPYQTGMGGSGAWQRHQHATPAHDHPLAGGVGAVSGATAGDETRPANLSVVWIIRIK